jgi:hypothetical protein
MRRQDDEEAHDQRRDQADSQTAHHRDPATPPAGGSHDRLVAGAAFRRIRIVEVFVHG